MLLSRAIDFYLAQLQAVPQHRQRKERVLCRPGRRSVTSRPRVEDISLLTFLGDRPLAEIGPADLLAYQTFLERAGYSPQSLRDFLADVRSLFNHARRAGYLTHSPASALRLPPQEPRDDVEFLAPHQLRRLLTLAATPSGPYRRRTVLYHSLHGLAYLGLRRGELLDLRWSDLDLEKRVAVIRGARKNPAKRARRRGVPIPEPLHRLLVESPRPADHVFTNSRGEGWRLDAFKSAFTRFRRRCRDELGFDVTPQVLRRTYGSVLYASGYSLDQIAEFLGNSAAVCRVWYVSLRAEEHGERVTRAFRGEG